MSKCIAIAVPKGGVGKTTTAVNLGATFAALEKRTLLIDTDPFGACSLSLGFTPEKTKGGLFQVFNFTHSLIQVVHRTELPLLDFVPSNIHSPQMEERFMRLAENRTLLKNALRGVAPHYDYVILDCPPFLRGLTTNALTCADSVLVPVKSGHFSLDAIDKLLRYLVWIRGAANKTLELEGILLTMYEPNTKVTDITERELHVRFRRYLLNTTIPKNTQLAEASFYGKPALLFNANSKGTLAYLQLAREIIARNLPAETAKPSPATEQQTGS